MSDYPNGYSEEHVDEVFELLSNQSPEILEFFKSRYSESEQHDLIISFRELLSTYARIEVGGVYDFKDKEKETILESK